MSIISDNVLFKSYFLLITFQAIENVISTINQNFQFLINKNKLKTDLNFISAENIEKIFKKNDVPEEFDFLTSDIDSNDY